ncbi:MAG TPA: hypothetical protein VGO62_02895 [Myxococcota bacterium]|jgi:hypothetical protein
MTPARRPRHGKPLLAARTLIGAGAMGVSMVGCPFVAANLVAVPNNAPECVATDDPSTWITATVVAQAPLTLSIAVQTFQVAGVTLANQFDCDGCVGGTGTPQFDNTSLATATSVNVTLVPNDGVTQLTVHTGVKCGDTARPLAIAVDAVNLTAVVTAL